MKSQTLTKNQCSQCRSDQVIVMNRMQYYLMLSALPYIVTIILTFTMSPIALVFVPVIHFINYKSAKKKTPFKICRSCKHISQGA